MKARVPTQSPRADAACPQNNRRKSLMRKTSPKPDSEIPPVGGGGGSPDEGSGTGASLLREASFCDGIEVASRAARSLERASRKGSSTSSEMYSSPWDVPGRER